ncbi:ATP-binding protein [Piscinibacter terrae]|uniref:Sensor histidine kinase n=1 Tax=Piscinibacter terrae TaxID=2496871 RepID=A0A3N7HMY4_9BURK|nr:HAMP domain-containing histidine kinase [Albitalea terrae]RQP22973.1 sensor histidine kinase [Albitalea terrae]
MGTSGFKVLAIDDNDSLRKALELYGHVNGWDTLALQSTWPQLRDVVRTRAFEPDAVLLDYSTKTLHDIAKWLREKGWNDRTLLISGAHFPDIVQKTATELAFAGAWLKPLALRDLPSLIGHKAPAPAAPPCAEPASPPAQVSLDALAHELTPSISILTPEGDVVRAFSTHGNDEKLDLQAKQDFFQLKAMIDTPVSAQSDAPRRTRADFVDWDPSSNRWVHLRLYRAGSYFWLTRDALDDPLQAEEMAMATLAEEGALSDRVLRLAHLLQQRRGITRVRFYELAQLPDDAVGGEPDTWTIPRVQRGGGFAGTAAAWLEQSFILDEDTSTNESGWNLVEVSDARQHHREPGRHGEAGQACVQVRWGNAETLMQFVVWAPAPNEAGQPSSREHGPPLALLALDRRTDHLNREDENLSGDDLRELVNETAGRTRAMPLTREEGGGLAHGLLRASASHVRAWIRMEREARKSRWNDVLTAEIISKVGQNVGSRRVGSSLTAFSALSDICERLRGRWAELWGADGQAPTDWYLVTLVNDDQWQAVAGSGQAYTVFREAGPLELAGPHAHAVAKARQALQRVSADGSPQVPEPTVYQDIDGRLVDELKRALPRSSVTRIAAMLDATRTWVAVPMVFDGGASALMVLHFDGTHAMHSVKLDLVAHAAKRLLPPLLVALSEEFRRENWTSAVVHELKTDSLALLGYQEEFKERHGAVVKRDEDLRLIQHLAEGLAALAQDYLAVMHEQVVPSDDDRSSELNEVFREALWPWLAFYRRHAVKLAWQPISPDDVDTERMPAPTWWPEAHLVQAPQFRRVLRVLLHNAFRHGAGQVRISGRWKTLGERRLFVLLVVNSCRLEDARTAPSGLHTYAAQVKPTHVRRTLGLENAYRLARDAGGTINTRIKVQDEAAGKAIFAVQLRWPVFSRGLSVVAQKEEACP